MSARRPTSSERLATKAEARKLSFYYGDFRALKNITMPVHERKVTALIRPSGYQQVHLPALLQPHARSLPRQPLRGRDRSRPDEAASLLARDVDPDRGAHADRHGVFQSQSLPEVGVRERSLQPARAQRVLRAGVSRRRWSRRCRTRRCGRK